MDDKADLDDVLLALNRSDDAQMAVLRGLVREIKDLKRRIEDLEQKQRVGF